VNVRAERFPLMDSLRAIAATALLALHASLLAGLYSSDSFLRPYVRQLDVGVPLFFVISGFLLYRPFVVARLNGDPQPRTGVYAWRRFLRIVPAYWVALTVVALWLGLSTVGQPLWHIPVLYGFGQIYSASMGFDGLAQAWTLCIEVTFYAFLPLWALAVRRLGWRGDLVALAALAVFSVGWKALALQQVHISDYATASFSAGPWVRPLPNFLDQFALGMGLAVVSARALPRWIERAVARAWPWWLAAAALYFVLVHTVGRSSTEVGTGTWIARHELRALVAIALLVPAVFAWERGGAVRRVLAWRPLLYMGLISYGIYLWNEAVLLKVGKATNGWLTDTLGLGADARFLALCAMGLAVVVAISTVSYYVVERPALALKRLDGPGRPRAQEGVEALAEPAPAAPLAAK
jgi:peptidoglycan/LPS O-acetylase OafA/YrhL